MLYARFDGAVAGLQFETRLPWIPDWGVYYQIGLDGYNVLLVLLTAFLGPLVVAGSFSAIQKDVKLFYAMVFLIQFAMLGTFVAQDLFVFYLFWETMLIPMFLIIGIWGGERRIYATLKFVLYTAFGSILMLAAVIYLVYALNESTGVTSFAFADLYRAELPVDVQTLLLAAFGLSFAIKVPMVPLHTWLPDAHVEAPTAGSVILAGVLLKMGTYGFMKLGFPLFPDATRLFVPAHHDAVGARHRLRRLPRARPDRHQEDHRLLVDQPPGLRDARARSASTCSAIQGAVIQMVSHGLTAAGLFLMVGMIYERCHTRDLAAYGGLAKLLPVYSVFFMILTLASIGLPTTSGFTGEFLVLLGAFRSSWRGTSAGNSYPARDERDGGDGRGARRALHAVLRAALPVRRGAGAAPAGGRPEPAREGRSWRRSSRRSSRSDSFPTDRCRRPSSRPSSTSSSSRASAARRRRSVAATERAGAHDELGNRPDRDAARAPAARRASSS